MWWTGMKKPFVITDAQYNAVPAISHKLPTYHGKNVHLLIPNSPFLLINFQLEIGRAHV